MEESYLRKITNKELFMRAIKAKVMLFKPAALTIITLIFLSFNVSANSNTDLSGYEFTPFVGYMFSSDIESPEGNELALSDDAHLGFAFSWQDSPQGQGQILVNYVTHEFESGVTGDSEDLKILYSHFSGVALFRQQAYVSTFSFGLGGAYVNSDYESGLYPSATVALGTRYEFSPFFALTTELRAYATLTDEDDDFFCKNDVCVAAFDDALYVDTSIAIGFAFAF